MHNLYKERSKVLLDMYYDYLAENGFCSAAEFAKWFVKQPAPRFYCDYHPARRFVSLILRGKENKNQRNMRMYYDLAEKLKSHPGFNGRYKFLPLEEIIEQPAPSFYLSEWRVISILYGEMRNRMKVKR